MRACLIASDASAHSAVIARRSLDLQQLLALSAPDDSGADLGDSARERGGYSRAGPDEMHGGKQERTRSTHDAVAFVLGARSETSEGL